MKAATIEKLLARRNQAKLLAKTYNNSNNHHHRSDNVENETSINDMEVATSNTLPVQMPGTLQQLTTQANKRKRDDVLSQPTPKTHPFMTKSISTTSIAQPLSKRKKKNELKSAAVASIKLDSPNMIKTYRFVFLCL